MSDQRDQLQAQAEAFRCRVETYPEVDALYLRDVPACLLGTPAFETFVDECRQHNIAAIQEWKEQAF